MESLFDKTRSLALGLAHSVLNKAIDSNSIPVMEQHVRDLQAAKDKVRNEAVAAKSRLASVDAEIEHYQEAVKKDNASIDFLLGDKDPSNDHLAEDIQMRIDKDQERIAAKGEDRQAAAQEADALEQVRRQLNDQFEQAVSQLQKLKRMVSSTAAKQQAAKSIKQAVALTGSMGSDAFDSAEQRAREQSAVADAELADATSQVGGASSLDTDIARAQARAKIEARRAKSQGGVNTGT